MALKRYYARIISIWVIRVSLGVSKDYLILNVYVAATVQQHPYDVLVVFKGRVHQSRRPVLFPQYTNSYAGEVGSQIQNHKVVAVLGRYNRPPLLETPAPLPRGMDYNGFHLSPPIDLPDPER